MNERVGTAELLVAVALTLALLGYAGVTLARGPQPRHPVQAARTLAALDTDASGALEAPELDGRDPPGRSWHEHDLDADGRLDAREVEIAMEVLDPRWLLPIAD